jgi:hypothetical protein
LVEGTFLGVTVSDLRSLAFPVVKRCMNGEFTDGTRLQRRWSGESQEGLDPHSILEWIGDEVDRAFPEENWVGKSVPKQATQHILKSVLAAKGKGEERGQPLDMSVRLVASTLALAIVCERLNIGPKPLVDLKRLISEHPEFAGPSRSTAR